MAERCHDLVSGCKLRLSEFCIAILGINPYEWQMRAYEDINDYRRTAVVAANGSGKTASLVVPAILWWLSSFPRGRVVITSGSWRQIEDQMWPAMTKYRAHPMFERWKWNHLDIKTPEGGFTSVFSTSDPRKAEGYHSEPDAPILYIVDECKGVQEGIFEAADRCTVTRYLYLSSPGAAQGKHYRCFHAEAKNWRRHKVTSFMCPHIRPEKRAEDLETYGEDHPLYKSMHLAEWTEGDDCLIMTPSKLRLLMENSPMSIQGKKHMFFDFAAGGDENAIGLLRGNKLTVPCAWRDKNTVQARRRFRREAESRGVEATSIYGDADGLGLPIVQDFREEGFRIREFHGGLKAEDENHYVNLISEVWIKGARILAKGKYDLSEIDPITFEQMTTRRMEWDSKGRLRVQSKEDMRANGLKSPDRADVLFGVLWVGSNPAGMWTDETEIHKPDLSVKTPQIWSSSPHEW